ncbi:MAG TPA: hypothetical protein VGI78_03700 [Acetobacteraceae bacterium]
MSAAAATSDPPPPGRSGRLLTLVRKLIDYGKHLAATLRPRAVPSDTTDLVCTFGTDHLPLILARVAQGLQRAGLLEERIARTAARLDAEPEPKPAPTPRAPRALPCEADAPLPHQTQPQQPTDAASLLANLPTPNQIAAKVRRQRIGAVLADICRDLGIAPSHPLWRELHLAINQYGGNWLRMAMERLNRAFPIAHIVARLKARPVAPPEPAGTGPPLAIPA